jgi:hypothetical protein
MSARTRVTLIRWADRWTRPDADHLEIHEPGAGTTAPSAVAIDGRYARISTRRSPGRPRRLRRTVPGTAGPADA